MVYVQNLIFILFQLNTKQMKEEKSYKKVTLIYTGYHNTYLISFAVVDDELKFQISTRPKRGFGLLALATKPSETRVVH